MITVTLEEIAQYRSELEGLAEAQEALDVIEDCEGELEDAAIAIALRAGQEPDRSDQWLDGVAKRWRPLLCQTPLKENLSVGALSQVTQSLAERADIPLRLAIPIAIYVYKTGVDAFCKPLEEKL